MRHFLESGRGFDRPLKQIGHKCCVLRAVTHYEPYLQPVGTIKLVEDPRITDLSHSITLFDFCYTAAHFLNDASMVVSWHKALIGETKLYCLPYETK